MEWKETMDMEGTQKVDISDHVAEAYFGKMGEKFYAETRKRIGWICEQVIGPRALDIGCSQGITEILLGREGIQVLGIDIAPEAIQYAETMLAEEPMEVQQNIRFLCSDFFDIDLPDRDFDTLILSEILEHLLEPEKLLEKALLHLRTGGRIVITVPFGINDFPDHKRTYYVLGILELLQSCARIENVEYMGGWIGFVATKQSAGDEEIVPALPFSILRGEEEAFFTQERALRDTVKKLKEEVKSASAKAGEAVANYKASVQLFAEQKERSAQLLAEQKEKTQRVTEDYRAARQLLAEQKEQSAQLLAEQKEKTQRVTEDYRAARQLLAEQKEQAAQLLAEQKEKTQRVTEDYRAARQLLAEQKEESAQLLAEQKEKTRRATENYQTAKQWLSDEREKSASALKRAAEEREAVEKLLKAEAAARTQAETDVMQLQFLMQQREEESFNLQRELTQRIITSEKSLKAANQEIENAEKQLAATKKKLAASKKELAATKKKLKKKTLPSIWYTMAGSRIGRMLCRIFGWYHKCRRFFR